MAAAPLLAVAVILALGSAADAMPAASAGTHSEPAPVPRLHPAVFPGCAWPVETTPTKVNVAAPDPYATYWITPFLAKPGYSITIKGAFPTTRFMSFVVYNDSFDYFANTVRGKSVPSYLTDYQMVPRPGSRNPWRTANAGRRRRFTVRLLPRVTAAQQRSANAIPMIDQDAPADPAGPPGIGYVIFRVYIPAGGNSAVRLPAIIVTHDRHRAALPPCTPSGSAAERRSPALARALSAVTARARSMPAACTSGCASPELQYFGPSADETASLSPIRPTAISRWASRPAAAMSW